VRNDLAQEIRSAFRNPRELCALLGIDQGAKRQANNGITVRCPIHAENSPSCSVTNGPDGTVRFKCFGCDNSGDALTLIAAARGLSLKSQFRIVLEAAAELGGLWRELEELRGNGPAEPRPEAPQRPAPTPAAEREYPNHAALKALWEASTPVADDRFARAELERRGLDPVSVANADLARVLPGDSKLPNWARYRGMTWNHTGHRMIVLVYDADGAARSVRAWKIHPEYQNDAPKRLPPVGCRASQLVLANRHAVALLRGRPGHGPVVVTEGEPDFLVRSMLTFWVPVFGIGSGSWHEGFAARIPYGGEVVVRTHRDPAGERYADRVIETLRARAHVSRLVIEEEPEAA